jgi:hypothetical protein
MAKLYLITTHVALDVVHHEILVMISRTTKMDIQALASTFA